MDLKTFVKNAQAKWLENKAFLKKLKKKEPHKVDDIFYQLHEEVFTQIDCLSCANCCKTTSPIFYPKDVARIASALRITPGFFTEKYLRIDEDNDYVLKTSPCPFLDSQNHCTIYDYRPKACREYPHTDRKKITQILELTCRNTLVCPAVFEIIERIKKP